MQPNDFAGTVAHEPHHRWESCLCLPVREVRVKLQICSGGHHKATRGQIPAPAASMTPPTSTC